MEKLIKSIEIFPTGSYCIQFNREVETESDIKKFREVFEEISKKSELNKELNKT